MILYGCHLYNSGGLRATGETNGFTLPYVLWLLFIVSPFNIIATPTTPPPPSHLPVYLLYSRSLLCSHFGPGIINPSIHTPADGAVYSVHLTTNVTTAPSTVPSTADSRVQTHAVAANLIITLHLSGVVMAKSRDSIRQRPIFDLVQFPRISRFRLSKQHYLSSSAYQIVLFIFCQGTDWKLTVNEVIHFSGLFSSNPKKWIGNVVNSTWKWILWYVCIMYLSVCLSR